MPAAPLRRPDRAAWLWALTMSVLAHVALLEAPASSRLQARAPAMLTRQLQRPAPAAQAAALARSTADQGAGRAETVKPTERAKPVMPVTRLMAASAPATTAAPTADFVADSGPDPATEPAAPTPPPLAISPSGEWHYRLRQNGQEGAARLSWQKDNASYQLLLERELAGRPLPAWRSVGGFDDEGLAPRRFAHQKRGRDVQAANFRRDEGLISFSASSAVLPLPAGVQDRLSWWMQIPARLAGAPQCCVPGSELRLMVAGLRGELQEWRFEVLETAPLVHLRRAALGPYDEALQLWLDPQRAYLPARLLVGAAEPSVWEMVLIGNDKAKP